MKKRGEKGVSIGLVLILGVFLILLLASVSAITPKCENKYQYILEEGNNSNARALCSNLGSGYDLVNFSGENEAIDVFTYMTYSSTPKNCGSNDGYHNIHKGNNIGKSIWANNYAHSALDDGDWIIMKWNASSTLLNQWSFGDINADTIGYCGICEKSSAACEPSKVFSASNLNNGLVAYWPLDYAFGENTATTPNTPDVIGNNHGTLSNGINCNAVPGATAFTGEACKFDGSGDVIRAPNVKDNVDFRLGNFTFAAWINGSGYIFDLRESGGDSELLGCHWTRCYFYTDLKGGDNAITIIQTSSGVYNPNQWTHIVLTKLNNDWKIYINGVLNKSEINAPIIRQAATHFNIGYSADAGGASWKGQLDELGVWNRELSASEVQQLYNSYFGIAYSILSASWNTTEIIQNNPVKMLVVGSSLTGKNINYTIYNSTNKIVFSSNHSASNATSDSMVWTPSIVGNYSFIAKLVENSSINATSNQLRVNSSYIAPDFELVPCNGSLPANSEWNSIYSGTDSNKFSRNATTHLPAENNATYNETRGECHFNCSNGFYWDSDSKTCIQVPISFCWQITNETQCRNAPPSIAKTTLGEAGSECGLLNTTIGNCRYNTSCSCVWRDGGCNVSEAKYDRVGSCTEDKNGTCIFTYNVNYKCGEQGNNICVNAIANWTGNVSDASLFKCADYAKEYAGFSSAKLGFFSNVTLIISIVIIILVYFIVSRRLRNKKQVAKSSKKKKA